MTLAQSASAASPLTVMTALIFGAVPKRRFKDTLFRVRTLSSKLPREIEETGISARAEPAMTRQGHTAPARANPLRRIAPPKPSIIETRIADLAVDPQDARLRWPITDGLSTWAGTGLTSAFAFAVMLLCAVVAAEFAPGGAPSALERAALQAVAPTAIAR